MRDTAGPSRHSVLRSSLILWLFLFLAPIAGLALLLSHTGSAWLDRGAIRPASASVLPGLTVEDLPSRSSRSAPSPHGRLVITSIRSNSPATSHGLSVGDTVVAIDGARIFSLDQARRSLQKSRADTVALRVAHGRDVREVRLVRATGGGHEPKAAHRRR